MGNDSKNRKQADRFKTARLRFQKELSHYINKLEPDELWALAYFLRVPDINLFNPKSNSTTNNLKQLCIKIIPTQARALFTDIKEVFNIIIEMELIKYANDENAFRTFKLLERESRYLIQEKENNENNNYSISLRLPDISPPDKNKFFPVEAYGKKELIANFLLIANELNFSCDDIVRLDRDTRRNWMKILNSDELKLGDTSEETSIIFLEELNKHLKKTYRMSHKARSLSEVLLNMDSLFSSDEIHRRDFVKKAKASLSQRKHRNKGNSKQKNLSLQQSTIKTLAELSRKYEISEAQVISLIIDGERKSPTHLENFIRREKRIEESYRAPED